MTDPNPEMEEGKREEERRGTGRYNSIVGKKSVVIPPPPREAGLSVCLEKGFPRRRTELQSGSNDIFATAVLVAGSDCFHLVGGFFAEVVPICQSRRSLWRPAVASGN